jgi:hypothetical protein
MNNSPYLDRPLLPLAVALPRMLEKIQADLAAAGRLRRGAYASELSCSASCLRRDPQPPSRPSRGLNRIGGPVPVLPQSLPAAAQVSGAVHRKVRGKSLLTACAPTLSAKLPPLRLCLRIPGEVARESAMMSPTIPI